jgi:hypothetical protein
MILKVKINILDSEYIKYIVCVCACARARECGVCECVVCLLFR